VRSFTTKETVVRASAARADSGRCRAEPSHLRIDIEIAGLDDIMMRLTGSIIIPGRGPAQNHLTRLRAVDGRQICNRRGERGYLPGSLQLKSSQVRNQLDIVGGIESNAVVPGLAVVGVQSRYPVPLTLVNVAPLGNGAAANVGAVPSGSVADTVTSRLAPSVTESGPIGSRIGGRLTFVTVITTRSESMRAPSEA